MQKITTFLMFESRAEEAMDFYASVFKNARVISKTEAGGQVMGTFEIDGQQFHAYNGGPHFKFTEAISLLIDCKDQEEVDYLWERLTSGGGEESMCGWVKDKFGVSWQVVPRGFMDLMTDSSATPAQKTSMFNAMLQMKKLDLQKLKDAFEGK